MKHGMMTNMVEKICMPEELLAVYKAHEAHRASERKGHIHMHHQENTKTIEDPTHFVMQR